MSILQQVTHLHKWYLVDIGFEARLVGPQSPRV